MSAAKDAPPMQTVSQLEQRLAQVRATIPIRREKAARLAYVASAVVPTTEEGIKRLAAVQVEIEKLNEGIAEVQRLELAVEGAREAERNQQRLSHQAVDDARFRAFAQHRATMIAKAEILDKAVQAATDAWRELTAVGEVIYHLYPGLVSPHGLGFERMSRLYQRCLLKAHGEFPDHGGKSWSRWNLRLPGLEEREWMTLAQGGFRYDGLKSFAGYLTKILDDFGGMIKDGRVRGDSRLKEYATAPGPVQVADKDGQKQVLTGTDAPPAAGLKLPEHASAIPAPEPSREIRPGRAIEQGAKP